MKKQTIAIAALIIIVLSASSVILFDGGSYKVKSRVIHVDSLGGSDYVKIQEAIDDAKKGDTIDISPGEYFETLLIDKSVIIKGHDGTIIHPRNASENQNSLIYISAENCTIENLTLENSQYYKNLMGININSSDTIIKGNKISKFEYGIYLKDEVRNGHVYTGIEIAENEVSNNSYGIYLYANAENNIIEQNDVIDNIDGITVYYFLNNTIRNNFVFSNSQYGIYLNINSDANVVNNNICTENRYGIRFKGVSYNEIFLNRLERNELGLYSCCGSSFNTIYKNTCIDNEKHASDGFYNSWDNGVDGNYWDDYIPKYQNATKLDGHWSVPYNISDGDNLDNFPLVNPTI